MKKKAIWIIKGRLSIYTAQEHNDPQVKKRIARQCFFEALFENLPQFVLQLYEAFEQGYTFGFFRTFSIILSIVMF